MRKTGVGIGALAAALALAIAPGAIAPIVQSSPASPASVTAPNANEKQAPTQAPTNANVDLNFLAELGAPLGRSGGMWKNGGRSRTGGIPWPGRKIACMMRTAGRTKRMRH